MVFYQSIIKKTGVLIILAVLSAVLMAQDAYEDSLTNALASSREQEKPEIIIKLSYHYLKKDSEKARQLAEEARKISRRHKQHQNTSEAYKLLGIVWQNQAAYDSAFSMYEKGLHFAQLAGDHAAEAWMYGYLGYVTEAAEDFEQALAYYRKSLEISLQNNNIKGIANAYNHIGIIYQNIRNYDSSVIYYQKALPLFEKANSDKGKAETYNNMGVVEFYQGDYEAAIKHFLQALEIKQKLGDKRSVGIYLGNIAGIYQMMSNYPKAIEYYNKALKINREMGKVVPSAIMLGNLGNVYQEWGKFDSSLLYFEQALNTYKEAGNQRGTAITTSNIGNVYHALGQFDKAARKHKEAIEVFTEMEDKQELANACNKLSISLADLGSLAEAQSYNTRCIELARELGLNQLLQEAYHHMAELYEKAANYRKANEFYKVHMLLKDSLLNEEKHQQIAELQEKYETAEKDRKIASLNQEKKIQNLRLSKQRNRIWFILISAVSLIFIILLIVYINRLRQKNKQEQLKKQKLETEKKLLLMQMNPHFIFNSLNSVHSFITSNKTAAAKEYLAKFSSLMRLILESSRKSMILLEDEIEMLGIYLGLEKARFENKFDYHIDTTGIKTDEVWIPPMLIQPFVENAVKHGISKLTGNRGEIEIRFKYKKNHLLCLIDDNGPGIKTTTDDQKSAHTSMGMQLTNERLNLLASQYKTELIINITDLGESGENEQGTRIEIELPYEKD